MKDFKSYRATPKLLDAIKSGTFEFSGVTMSSYYTPIYDCLIEIGKDFTLTLRIDQEALEKNPDYFEEIK